MMLRQLSLIAAMAALCSACGGGSPATGGSGTTAAAGTPAASTTSTTSSGAPTTSASPTANGAPASGGAGAAASSAAAPSTVEDPGGVLAYVHLPLPANAVWTASKQPQPASPDVKHGAWAFTLPGRTYPSCALRVTVQSGFAGDLTALKLQFEQANADATKLSESTLTKNQNGYAQELVQASTGVEQAADGSRHPYTTWAHSIVTRSGTFLQVVGVAHDEAASTCQAEQAVRKFAPAGGDTNA